MSIKAWPFLVSRNLYLDYRTVVAPDFICNAQISNLLARAADGDLTDANKVICRKIIGSKVGDLTLFFQVLKGTKADIGHSEDTTAIKDSFGREIYLIRGLVFNQYLDTISLTLQDFGKLYSQLKEAYCKFWELTEPTLSETSTAFDFCESASRENSLSIEVVEPFQLNQSQVASANFEKLELKKTFTSHYPLGSIAFSPDGQFLVCRTDRQTLHKYNLEREQEAILLFNASSSDLLPSTISFSPDGKFIASGIYLDGRNCILLWNNFKGQEEKRLFEKNYLQPDFKQGTILTSIFNPDGQILASGSKYGSIILWETLKYKKIILADDLSEVQALAFTPDGEILISGEKAGIVNVWLYKSKLKSQPLECQLSSVNAITCSPNGNFVAIGCEQSLEIWNFRNRIRIYSEKNDIGINSLAFSPDNQVLAVGFQDGNVKLWNLEKERYLISTYKHEGAVSSVAFSNQGQMLGSCGEDGSIKIWQY
ncbi:WD40 repeat domain-containing protein [Nostoc sp. FACHB-145]|uniref:WD40 repeat domain-containing protein n=1 Tax=Nostoc sp. FACHB-145 TaxID=2692836 RepID=UPI001682C461|nr:WD40 repeat domain-containing protein [Nostoc sp. FACHB-145]MBD2471563.1 WD40 repeat domain-containing protein [Nostoc sp. FACHB-145]